METSEVKALSDHDLDKLFTAVWHERLGRLRKKNGPKIQKLRDEMYDALLEQEYAKAKDMAREIEHLSGAMRLP